MNPINALSDAHYFEEMGVKKFEEIRSLLDNRDSKQKLEGMKRLMAVIPISLDPDHVPVHTGSQGCRLTAGCGMWWCRQMISLGRDASALFPEVVKNVVCESLEVKKLVYAFLVQYAEVKPEMALLSINTFQKDLSVRPSPRLRRPVMRRR